MKYSIKGLTQILFLVGIWGLARSQSCPDPAAITPCKCDLKDATITCSGDKAIDLKAIFEKIGDNQHKIFTKFTLTNSAVQTLEDNVFGTVAFKSIEITDAYSLSRVARNAFNSSVGTLVEFRQIGDNKMTDSNSQELFDALSSLTEINRIFLDFTQITTIPDNAFRIINGRQGKLESIHMNYIGGKYGSLAHIGDKAFYYLDNLKYVSIANQPIKHLKSHSFDFEKSSDQTLEIHMEATQIRGDSFEEGIFQDAKRPLNIDMSNNQMDYLDEKVFKPVFEIPKPNVVVINIQNNRLLCGDCRMKWLVVNKTDYIRNLLEPDCTDGDELWDKTLDTFSKCP